MTSALCQLTSEDLSQLAGALRSGRIAPPFSPLVLRRYVSESMAALVAIELQQRVAEGMESRHLADCLEMLCQDRRHRPVAEDLIDLVWTGPEAPGIVNRDTSVVVREMFRSAEDSVLRGRICRLPGPRRLQGTGGADGPDPRATGADVPGHTSSSARSIQPVGVGPHLRRTIRPQGMAGTPTPETLLRSEVVRGRSSQTHQPACKVCRGGQGGGICLFSEFH